MRIIPLIHSLITASHCAILSLPSPGNQEKLPIGGFSKDGLETDRGIEEIRVMDSDALRTHPKRRKYDGAIEKLETFVPAGLDQGKHNLSCL